MRKIVLAMAAVWGLSIAIVEQAVAQDSVFVQIEAQPNLNTAQDRARDYASNLADVNGFALGSGWYGIALGPYSPEDADFVLRELRRNGRIPSDSYIVEPRRLRQQFWPIGANTLANLAPNTPTPETEPDPDTTPVVQEAPQITPSDETLREARSSEAQLLRDEKKDLQIALKWAGTYAGAIDGSYGRGTRRAMALWQEQNNYEPTGVLTTKQRAALLKDYNSILEGLGLQVVRDDAAGIEMKLPLDVVDFASFEPPFVQYNATGELNAQVLLISQQGNESTLFGLYEILQTLEIVPLDGPRTRRKTNFDLTGINDRYHTEIFAELRRGEIKGFALVWPAGDEKRQARVFQEMRDSFQGVEGVLDPALARFDGGQSLDLVSGLALRKPIQSRSGFFVTTNGAVVTSADAVQSCTRITLDDDTEGSVSSIDESLGLALVTPKSTVSPIDIARFQTATPRIQSDVAVAGYPYEGVLGAPSVTFGKLADIRGLKGEEELKRLSIFTQPGDAGGPVLDRGGAVLGKLLPKTAVNGQTLPEEVSFAIDAAVITEFLSASGVAAQTVDKISYIAPEDMIELAANFTVLVSCWE